MPAFRVFFNEAAIRESEENCLAEEWTIESPLLSRSGKVLRVRFAGVIGIEDVKGSDFLSSGIHRVRAVAEVLETHSPWGFKSSHEDRFYRRITPGCPLVPEGPSWAGRRAPGGLGGHALTGFTNVTKIR